MMNKRSQAPPVRRADAYWLEKNGTWGPPPKGWREHLHEPIVKRISWQVSEIFRGLLRFEEQITGPVFRVYYEKFVDHSKEITSDLLQFIDAKPSYWQERLPIKFPNYNPPWFHDSDKLDGRFGEERFYESDERDQLQEVVETAIQSGYDPHRIGIVLKV